MCPPSIAVNGWSFDHRRYPLHLGHTVYSPREISPVSPYSPIHTRVLRLLANAGYAYHRYTVTPARNYGICLTVLVNFRA